MTPKSIEEKLICIADLFYSKSGDYTIKERPINLIRSKLSKFGKDNVIRFNKLCQELNIK